MGNFRRGFRKFLSKYVVFLIIYSFFEIFFNSSMNYSKYYVSLIWNSTNDSLPTIRRRGGIAVTLEVTLDVSLKTLHPEEQSNEEMPFSIR
jgi:hypothetical protein